MPNTELSENLTPEEGATVLEQEALARLALERVNKGETKKLSSPVIGEITIVAHPQSFTVSTVEIIIVYPIGQGGLVNHFLSPMGGEFRRNPESAPPLTSHEINEITALLQQVS